MYLTDKISISAKSFTDEGYMVIEAARIARSGIQEYFAGELKLADRDPFDVIKIYRPEKEVFNDSSMGSFANKPVTNNHPEELLNAKNAKEFTVGHSGETVSKDGIFLITKLTVTDDVAIRDVQGGKSELSNGYTSEVDFVAGVTDGGEEYDAIQTNIKGNHIAIVNKARCGSECKINDELNKGKENMLILLDGIEFDCTDKTMAQAINKILAVNTDLKQTVADNVTAMETLTSTHKDAIKDLGVEHKKELDKLTAKVDDAEANKVTPELLDSLVAKRTEVIAVAAKVIENFDAAGKDCEAIRTEVVQAISKDLDLSDKSPEYILARFEGIQENVAAGNSNTLNDALKKHAQTTDDGNDESKSEAAREKMCSDSRGLWKKPVNAVAS